LNVIHTAVLLWSLPVVVMDIRSRSVHWLWSLAGMLVGFLIRARCWIVSGFDPVEALLISAVSAVSFELWRKRIWGGADAKTAMTQMIFLPELGLLLLEGVLVLLTAGLALIYRRSNVGAYEEPAQANCSRQHSYPMAAALCFSVLLYLLLCENM